MVQVRIVCARNELDMSLEYMIDMSASFVDIVIQSNILRQQTKIERLNVFS
jgi:hypothetical protein